MPAGRGGAAAGASPSRSACPCATSRVTDPDRHADLAALAPAEAGGYHLPQERVTVSRWRARRRPGSRGWRSRPNWTRSRRRAISMPSSPWTPSAEAAPAPRMAPAPRAGPPLLGIPLAHRTSSHRRVCARPAPRACWQSFVPPYDAPRVNAWTSPGPAWWCPAPTWTSSRWARPTNQPSARWQSPGWDTAMAAPSGGSAAAVAAGIVPFATGTGHRWLDPPTRSLLRYRRPEAHHLRAFPGATA